MTEAKAHTEGFASLDEVEPLVSELQHRVHELARLDGEARTTKLHELAREATRAATGAKPTELRSIGALVDGALVRVMARANGGETPVPMPWPELSAIYRGGLWPGMHLLVAGTGVGKTQWSLQLAHHAAANGIRVGYVGLELDELQVTLRLASLVDRTVPWSDWFVGCRDDNAADRAHKLGRLPAALDALRGLPIRLDFASPHGWPASRLGDVAREVRASEPDATKPILVVLDFLQLVGDEPGDQRRVELRERIGRAAYQARAVAIEHNAAVLLISSTARENYLSGEVLAALAGADVDGHELRNPDSIVGMGKESGELEFSGDSVAVMARMAHVELDGGRAILFSVPKVRAGRARWDALRFNGHRLDSLREPAGQVGERMRVESAVEAAVALGADKLRKGSGRTKRDESEPAKGTAKANGEALDVEGVG
jgi:hypothetical protein